MIKYLVLVGTCATLGACGPAKAPDGAAAPGKPAGTESGTAVVVDRSADSTAPKVPETASKAIETRMVVVEDDPSQPSDPTLRCEWPQRLRNKNAIRVSVRYTMHYRGNGAPNCNAQWSQEQAPRVMGKAGSADDTYYVGCAVYHLPGGACTEYRDWEVLEAVPAR